jgi:hypothetical protein
VSSGNLRKRYLNDGDRESVNRADGMLERYCRELD